MVMIIVREREKGERKADGKPEGEHFQSFSEKPRTNDLCLCVHSTF